jgi:hypothetical protein
MMKLLERRMRVSWGWLILAALFSTLAILALGTDELLVLRGRIGRMRSILRASDPDGFLFFLIGYVVTAAVGWLFAFYQFRRGSWFNPI